MTWNENSRADPHVKIIGKPEHVEVAKQMILQVLDTKKNRVTLKMDVSHSDHSYIIGKGGFKIQQVMEETGCHIHFPDSNRNSNAEKSNQVSIAGEADGVEIARNKIRDLLPLVYMFELPNGISAKPGDENGPVLQHIQQTYSFNVAFRTMPTGRVLIVVRGCHRLLQRLRSGLILLMEYLIGSKTVPVVGIMKTEIAAQHHSFVMGMNGINIQMIMNKTGATITFPDPAAPPNSTLLVGTATPLQPVGPTGQLGISGTMQAGPHVLQTKTSVIIQGSFDCVCAAWDELLKSLPLALMFDLKEGQDVDSMLINRLMEKNSINIMVRPKIRENVKSVIIRSAEKDSKILFETRKEILGIQEHVRPLNTYGQPVVPPRRNSVPNPEVPLGINDFSTAESLAMLTSLIQQNPDLIGLLNNLSAAIPAQNPTINGIGAVPAMANSYTQKPPLQQSLNPDKQRYENQGAWPKVYSDAKAKNGQYGRSFNRELPPFLLPSANRNSPNSPEDSDSGYFSNRSRYLNGSSQACSSASSSTSSLCNEPHEASEGANRRFFSSLKYQKEYKEPANTDFASLIADYENKKITATKAMYEDICDGVRTPTTVWSGYGFSKSVPEFAMKGKMPKLAKTFTEEGAKYQQLVNAQGTLQEYQVSLTTNGNESGLSDQACASDYSASNTTSPIDHAEPSPFSLSNFWEKITPASPCVGYNSIRDLQQLFTYFDLDQYTELFIQQEIDLPSFLTLTDCDLQQLNISYSARRRMLNAIAAMRESTKIEFSLRQFKAAPGAERKPLFSRMSASDA